MATTTVVNLKGHRDDPAFADVVYVGRPMHRGGWHLAGSPLASPFRLGVASTDGGTRSRSGRVPPSADGSRDEVLAKYREYLLGRPDLLALIPPLRGRRLGCWCAPLACHAMVIAEFADAPPDEVPPADGPPAAALA